MAAPIERLKQRSEFLRVAAARRKWVTPGLILQAAPRPRASARQASDEPDAAPFRIGYTASRKVGGAVTRNRARRRLRAAVAEVMPAYAQGGCDYVLIARRETVARPFAELVRDLETALDRLAAKRGSR